MGASYYFGFGKHFFAIKVILQYVNQSKEKQFSQYDTVIDIALKFLDILLQIYIIHFLTSKNV